MKIKGLKHITLTELELIFAAAKCNMMSDDKLSKRRQQQVQDRHAGGKGSEESANRNEFRLTQNCFSREKWTDAQNWCQN